MEAIANTAKAAKEKAHTKTKREKYQPVQIKGVLDKSEKKE